MIKIVYMKWKDLWRTGDTGNLMPYILGTVAASFPVFLAAAFYTNATMTRNKGLMALLITVYFLIGIYIGRYMSLMWITRHKVIPRAVFTWLALIIFICVILIFIVSGITPHLENQFVVLLYAGVPLFILSVATGMVIKLVRATVKKQLLDARASAHQSQSELQLLQSQLSPHFLFNTLNNIYGISLTRHEKVPALLLKLADLLRYSVYDAKEQFVPLQSEMEYIHNYINFEKIRIGEKLALTTDLEMYVDPKVKIAPLLLIVFIENAFKHAKNTTEQEIMIEIKIKTWGNFILFSVKNSNKAPQEEKGMLNAHSGFGLDNVRKRLELLYKHQYDLEIKEDENFYTVMLQLKAK